METSGPPVVRIREQVAEEGEGGSSIDRILFWRGRKGGGWNEGGREGGKEGGGV